MIDVYMATLDEAGPGPAVMAGTTMADTLRSMLRDYLDAHAPMTQALSDAGRTSSFVAAFQPAALLVPEEFGGAGAAPAEAMAVAAESGRALLGGEVLAHLLASAAALWAPPSDGRRELLTGLASGAMQVTAPVWTADGLPTVTGSVLGAFPASYALVFSSVAGELRLRCAEVTPEMVTARGGMDPTRQLGRIEAPDQSPGIDLARGGDAERVRARYVAFARTVVAAEQVAGARRCVEMTVEYAGQRTQFGVPIASFQAFKHTCATMHVNTAEAEALAAVAAQAAGSHDARSSLMAGQAKALASEAFINVTRSAIEVHGGVGFAWEHPVQLFYKRALVTAAYFGRPAGLYAQVAERARTARAPGDRPPTD
jgi:alkylation response protein AidB-like acyl-CoA dehydrogenase